ncbi:BQ2448_3126 [Microbotryum intermedium]|uniref:Replication factor C subunit 1 n=1 Tax=Microbotryum intermedium TaxID=269621 RepID=A0A238FK42_9BASI|nr:BQ2448_3126 [Microbotryum intermedium]
MSSKKSKAAATITLSSDSEDSKPITPSKTKTKIKPTMAMTTTLSSSKRSTPVKKTITASRKRDEDGDYAMDDDDDDEEEEFKPSTSNLKKKGTSGAATASSFKRKSIVPTTEEDSDDDDDDEAKGKGKAKAKVKVAPVQKKPKVEDEEDKAEAKPKPKWSYKPRAGPSAPGSKDVPVGAENCLAGLTFVFTGELDSLSREQGQELVKRYGGRVTSAPSSKTSFIVLGQDAGPKKLEMIKKHKLKTLNEDTFLELIGKRPSGAADPKFKEQQKKEEAKVQDMVKEMSKKKDGPERLNQLWTVKYAPTKLSEVCGNKSTVEKLSKWLQAWAKSLKSDFKKPGPDAMGVFRAVLISGPPGVGKTTSAHLVAKQFGYDILELNASDVRSKKLLESAFKSKTSDTTISGFFKKEDGSHQGDNLGISKKSIIIMDEVDGMSAGDRGGVGALNALIRKTKVPIIAICNDNKSPKMKPLATTCFQMIFRRPTAPEIRSRIMSIAFKEQLKIPVNAVDQLIAGSQSDIRQVVNMLSTWKLSQRATMDFDDSKKLAKMNEKNMIQTPWTLYGKLFSPGSFAPNSAMSLNEKLEVYFHDHSIMPLFVQENYLRGNFTSASRFSGKEQQLKKLELVCNAADALSDSDLIDRMIHGSEQHWSLMPTHGMLSCVRPAFYCHGGGGYPMFPAWLGKNSAQSKMQRLLGDVQIHMRLRVSGDRREIRQSYIPTLFQQVVTPIIERGAEAVPSVIETLDNYYLTKEDWDSIVELGVGDHASEPLLKKIPAAAKATFTRKYNASDHPVPFNKNSVGKPAIKIANAGPVPDLEEALLDDEEVLDSDEGEDNEDSGSDLDISKDKLIKNKATGANKKGKSAAVTKRK